ncbi:uncharacterized protein LOC144443122 [Glandiceps talaboti]
MEIETSTYQSSPVKAILWTGPRCLGTAFERCMRNLPNVEAFHEPFVVAATYGLIGERRDGFTHLPYHQGVSYQQTKTILEGVFPASTKIVFVKDIAVYLGDHFDKMPKGFHHSFLIRHPAKIVASLMRGFQKVQDVGFPYFDKFYADEIGIKALLTLYNYLVKEKIECEPIIVDADDLQRNPAMMMQKYCQAVGIPYNKCMLTWKPEISQKFMEELTRFGPVELWHGAVVSRDGLHPSSPSNGDDIDVTVYPEEVQLAIQDCMPSYKQLYECRLR